VNLIPTCPMMQSIFIKREGFATHRVSLVSSSKQLPATGSLQIVSSACSSSPVLLLGFGSPWFVIPRRLLAYCCHINELRWILHCNFRIALCHSVISWWPHSVSQGPRHVYRTFFAHYFSGRQVNHVHRGGSVPGAPTLYWWTNLTNIENHG